MIRSTPSPSPDNGPAPSQNRPTVAQARLARELATESIAVRIRWFGIVMGYALVFTRTGLRDPRALAAILALGAGYALLDTVFYRRGDVFLRRWPLFVSLMESLFIALLCTYDTGLDSPFRWYFLLSLICCSIRYEHAIAWTTFALHSLSVLAVASIDSSPGAWVTSVPLTVVILAWVTWAGSSLSSLLRQTGDRLERANVELEAHRDELERRVADRTAALRASLARELQKEKLSAFGLLAAGIAHEVGNPLAAISSLVQMLQRRKPDPYTEQKLELAGRQLERIQRTIRELVDFSRPVNHEANQVRVREVVEEALGIVKYYHRTKGRTISTEIDDDLPALWTVRDHLTQVLFNLVLNAIDATEREGRIHIVARVVGDRVVIEVEDDGVGIEPEDLPRLFQPYFTTKPKGTGLGLFVSRQIVVELGGTLDCRSTSGAGTCFRLTLPLPRGEHGPAEVGVERPARAAVVQEIGR